MFLLVAQGTLEQVETQQLWRSMEETCYLECLVVLVEKMVVEMEVMDTVEGVEEEQMDSQQVMEALMAVMENILPSPVKEARAVA